MVSQDSTASSPKLVDDVPGRLIRTATQLYGESGTHAVSAREIQRQADVHNEAAVRYYFGDKLGLIDACLAQVSSEFSPIVDEAWAELDHKKADQGCSVTDVIAALLGSLVSLQFSNPDGVRLVARMIREEAEAGQDLLIRHFGSMIWRLEAELAELLPQKSARALRLHAFLAINSTVNGVVDQSLLWRLPATRDGQGNFHLSAEKLNQGFIEYVAAGVSAASSI